MNQAQITPSRPGGNWLSFRIGLAVGLVAQFLFMIGYSIWTEKTYPLNNSMAGFAGFMYGIPVGILTGIVAGFVTNRVLSRNRSH